MKQVLKVVIFAGIYYPVLFIALFYSFVARAISKLGYVPEYNHPDPKDLNFGLHRTLVFDAGTYLPVSISVLIIAVLIFFFKRSYLNIKPLHFIVSAILLLIVFLTFISPLMEWFGD